VRCAQKTTSRGGAGKGSGSKGCRTWPTRTGAVAVRAALESAVQVGRGNEGKQKWPTLRNVGIRYSIK
jgi:hypothetical protein